MCRLHRISIFEGIKHSFGHFFTLQHLGGLIELWGDTYIRDFTFSTRETLRRDYIA